MIPDIEQALVDSWKTDDDKSLQYVCVRTRKKDESDDEAPIRWKYSQELNQFVEDGHEPGAIKEVFGSAAFTACLLRSIDQKGENKIYDEIRWQLLNPEPECFKMYKFFADTGMPSYME